VADGVLLSEGTAVGNIQIPGDGQPIVLGVDRPTTGGYPVIACVIAADLPVLGSLRPRERVRFEWVTIDQAWSAWQAQEGMLDRLVPEPKRSDAS
jgi:allophanate hydrolase subunit 2